MNHSPDMSRMFALCVLCTTTIEELLLHSHTICDLLTCRNTATHIHRWFQVSFKKSCRQLNLSIRCPPYDVAAYFWGVDVKTYCKYIWLVIIVLYETLDTVRTYVANHC